jgi:hypothetical protein
MSIVRREEQGSHVYVHETSDGLTCEGCLLNGLYPEAPEHFCTQDVAAFLAHLAQHREEEHCVPGFVDDVVRQYGQPPVARLLVWTRDPPEREGWYWVEGDDGDIYMVEVTLLDDPACGMSSLWVESHPLHHMLCHVIDSSDIYRWAGPIAEPVEPPP